MESLRNIFCPKIVPLVYDDALSYYEYLNKIHCKVNEIINAMSTYGITILESHDSGRSYSYPTMIATNNKLYVTKQDVPQNIALTNTDYWAKVIDFDIQIEDLETEINAINTAISNINSLITTLNSNVVTLQNDVNNHRLWISQRETNLKNRKFLVLGDSYAKQSNSWVSVARGALGKTTDNFIDVSVSGAGFTISNNTFLDQLQNYTGVKSEITDILIGGGLNDSSPSAMTNLADKIAEFMTYARTNYPNANVSVYYIGNSIEASNVLYDRGVLNRLQAIWIYQTNLTKHGAKFVNFHNVLASNLANFGSDLLHPSTYGGEAIGLAIANDVRGSSNGFEYPYYTVEVSGVNIGSTFTGTLRMKPELNNSCLTLFGESAQLLINNGATITGGTKTKIARTNYFFNVPLVIKTRVQLGNFNNKQFELINAELSLEGQDVYLITRELNDTNTGYKNYTAGASASINVYSGSVEFPTYFIN